jgi:hypothetical protein
MNREIIFPKKKIHIGIKIQIKKTNTRDIKLKKIVHVIVIFLSNKNNNMENICPKKTIL